MSKNNSPSQRRFTMMQYGRGATRVAEAMVRTMNLLKLSPQESVWFVRVLNSELQQMVKKKTLEVPFIDTAINRALHRLNEKNKTCDEN